MKIFLAGATGVLGRRLVRDLVGRGHEVWGLARSEKGQRVVADLGGRPRQADLFDADALSRAAEGADAVIHAATAIPTKARTTSGDWQANDRIRRQGTEALAECAGRIGAKQFIFQSIVWLAAPPNDSEFDESSPPRPTRITQSALDGEQISAERAARHGYNACILRCGWFYGADSAHTRLLGAAVARRRMPIFGRGDNMVSQLHLDDAADAFRIATEAGQAGLWHVVDNEPLRVRDFLLTFAQLLAAPAPRSIPLWLARILAGKEAVDFITCPFRATNARFRRDFSWNPRYRTIREGLRQVVEAWGGKAPV